MKSKMHTLTKFSELHFCILFHNKNPKPLSVLNILVVRWWHWTLICRNKNGLQGQNCPLLRHAAVFSKHSHLHAPHSSAQVWRAVALKCKPQGQNTEWNGKSQDEMGITFCQKKDSNSLATKFVADCTNVHHFKVQGVVGRWLLK